MATMFGAFLAIASACADDTVVAGSGSEGESAIPTTVVLDAVLEPMNAVVDDFGDGWEPTDSWLTEGPDVEWDTGCEAFDRLDVFARSGPATSLWRSDTGDLVYRVQSLEFETPAYAAAVAGVARDCPTITVGDQDVALTALDADAVFGAGGEADTAISAIGLDSFPLASRDADLTGPVFESDRPTWQVTLSRYNTVAQLTYSPDSGTAVEFTEPPEELFQVVGLAWEKLSAAPVEAAGPIEQPGPPPTAGDQVVHNVVLRLGFECFEQSAISVGGLVFSLIDPLPESWIGLVEVRGTATIEGEIATFVAGDGTTLRLTSGAAQQPCTYWEFDENPPDTDTGRLDCDHPAADLVESRHPDTGQGPEAVAAAELAGTVRLEQGDPLVWWAIDAEGEVLGGIFLGDAEGADYQIFRCRE